MLRSREIHLLPPASTGPVVPAAPGQLVPGALGQPDQDEEMMPQEQEAQRQPAALPARLAEAAARGLQEAQKAMRAIEQARQEVGPIIAELLNKDTILEQFGTHVDHSLRLVDEHVLEWRLPQLCADMHSCQHHLSETVRLNNGWARPPKL